MSKKYKLHFISSCPISGICIFLSLVTSACNSGDPNSSYKDKKDKVECNKVCTDGFTKLHYAAYNGYVEIVKELLRAPDILANEEDFDKKTPLDIASENGHGEVVKLLLKAGGIKANEKYA